MIYFCIPAHNEERTVGVVLWKLRQVMAELQRDYQIIVVDDASTDTTAAVLSPYIRVLPLTVIRNAQRHGYADSLEIALREAVRRSPYPKRDAVITLQADFSEDPDVVPLLVKRIEAGADIVATNVALEPSASRSVRWGRRALRWFLRRQAWTAVGDPLSGLRAYRIVLLKRALDARSGARLLTWNGIGANVELLAQTVPHSRRSDIVESALKQHRMQRDSRFAWLSALREVRGAASGKPSAHARALPNDGVVALPQAVPLEPAQRSHARPADTRGRRNRGERPQAQRGPRRARPERKPNEKPERRPNVAMVETSVPAANASVPARKRRRPRRRKHKKSQNAPNLNAEMAAPANSVTEVAAGPEAAASDAAPRKKSRRGRRGGRGRRRPKPNGSSEPTGTNDNAAPPMAAEGD